MNVKLDRQALFSKGFIPLYREHWPAIVLMNEKIGREAEQKKDAKKQAVSITKDSKFVALKIISECLFLS